ncbi:hypothetical protein V499_00532 [Pseudogymnoascus sp. VKM F-103]|uniref:PH domain-containing protein n=1 Tax=Pseudogymnoascus verrucosus TaxID=342668 RepID=A0A1B8GVB1_9PEZI|nr:uncharacterized protein VE01_02005 [Pseudogymnoascus verrucosus]KFY80641.1 hypothetical protein V499_00532 [Pseudogymnoascus sp. VKM F-103]OBT99763.1 hypothetical protein VE01_02005 [Pseudogymnoascus verrucosus]
MDLDIIVTAPVSHDERDEEARTRKQKYIALTPQDDELEEYTDRDGAEYTPQPWSSTASSSIDEGAGDLEDLPALSQTVSQHRRVSIDQFYLENHFPDRTIHPPPPTRPPPPIRDAPSPTNTIASTTTTSSTSSDEPQTPRLTADDLVEQSSSLSPPPYSSSILNRSAINITPRIEEGHETLPPYTCDLTLTAHFMRKSELEGPHLGEPSEFSNPLRRAPVRTWHRVQVTLRGTSLTIAPAPRLSLKRSKPLAPPRSYSLQHAEAGIASDYLKRRYVIRIRVEADQLLLASDDAPTHIAWLEALAAAIDLAPALDERSLPEDASLPRPRRRGLRDRYVAPGSAAARRTAAAQAAVAAAEAAVAPPPRHVDVPEAPEPIPEPVSEPEPEPEPDHLAPPPSVLDSSPSSRTSTDTPTPIVRPSHRPQPDPYNIYPPTLAARGARNPAITRDGKWRPIHNWSPLYDLIYAKRCMATLLNGSPRKGPFVIMQGERWVVDWETGKCARWVPKEEGVEEGLPGEAGLPGYGN